jgi:hypothetical protein
MLRRLRLPGKSMPDPLLWLCRSARFTRQLLHIDAPRLIFDDEFIAVLFQNARRQHGPVVKPLAFIFPEVVSLRVPYSFRTPWLGCPSQLLQRFSRRTQIAGRVHHDGEKVDEGREPIETERLQPRVLFGSIRPRSGLSN